MAEKQGESSGAVGAAWVAAAFAGFSLLLQREGLEQQQQQFDKLLSQARTDRQVQTDQFQQMLAESQLNRRETLDEARRSRGVTETQYQLTNAPRLALKNNRAWLYLWHDDRTPHRIGPKKGDRAIDGSTLPTIVNVGAVSTLEVKTTWRLTDTTSGETYREEFAAQPSTLTPEASVPLAFVPQVIQQDAENKVRRLEGTVTVSCSSPHGESFQSAYVVVITPRYTTDGRLDFVFSATGCSHCFATEPQSVTVPADFAN